jgi:hypothetical protein
MVRSIAGRPTDTLTLTEARALLAAEDDRAVPITIERGGQVFETALKPRDLL